MPCPTSPEEKKETYNRFIEDEFQPVSADEMEDEEPTGDVAEAAYRAAIIPTFVDSEKKGI